MAVIKSNTMTGMLICWEYQMKIAVNFEVSPMLVYSQAIFEVKIIRSTNIHAWIYW